MKKKLLDRIKGISRPSEKTIIEFSRNPLNELKANYQYWSSIVRDVKEKNLYRTGFDFNKQLELGHRLYDEAMILTNSQINGINSSDVMGLINEQAKFGHKEYDGIYITALLNNSCLEEIIINQSGFSFLGFKLNKGRIKINRANHDFIGAYATGGIIENYGQIFSLYPQNIWNGSFGRFGSGAICTNHGEIKTIGDCAKGGIYRNYGDCFSDGIMGSNATEGIFLNYNSMKEMGYSAKGGFFYNAGFIHKMASYAQYGFFLNNGKILSYFGENTENGFYFNNGDVKKLGFNTSGGMYVNCGTVEFMGDYSKSDSIFIKKKGAKRNFYGAMRGITKIGKLRLLFNPKLNSHIKEIQKELNNQHLDIHYLKRLLMLAKENCDKNY